MLTHMYTTNNKKTKAAQQIRKYKNVRTAS